MCRTHTDTSAHRLKCDIRGVLEAAFRSDNFIQLLEQVRHGGGGGGGMLSIRAMCVCSIVPCLITTIDPAAGEAQHQKRRVRGIGRLLLYRW